MTFYIMDAFSGKLFGGNQAGVVVLPDGVDFPDDETMKKTDAELRYSETAFVKKLSDNEFQTRYFTPAAEVELCGHATIGTFCALLDLGLVENGKTYINHTLSGDLEIDVKDGKVLMDMASPVRLNEISEPEALRELYTIMGLDWDDEETAIEGIRSNVQTSSVFDMSGRKAQQNTLRSGLYIKNGKKYLVK